MHLRLRKQECIKIALAQYICHYHANYGIGDR